MNEIEAIEKISELKRYMGAEDKYAEKKYTSEIYGSLDIAIDALQTIHEMKSEAKQMNELEARERLKGFRRVMNNTGACTEDKEAINRAIDALQFIHELINRKFTVGVMEEYMKFEDSLVKNGWTLKSVLEVREKQIPKTPKIWDGETLHNLPICPICKRHVMYNANYCENCGQKLLWEGENDSD